MATPSLPALLVALAAVAGAALLVHHDARRVGVSRPRLWAAVVALALGAGLLLYLFVPTVPVPGLLVIVLAGAVFYLFERDDANRGDEPADPRVLPESADGDRSEATDESGES
ncbi:hypothetical protein [Salinilacihabitans rarus]|uniref:hypothetical protein n=1 Tax=Salinilacihabitans rarus TaxID=2961596 RepID=UPI0020C8552A|nr:hypothetical protein [Salinilacihabitans rarus]